MTAAPTAHMGTHGADGFVVFCFVRFGFIVFLCVRVGFIVFFSVFVLVSFRFSLFCSNPKLTEHPM